MSPFEFSRRNLARDLRAGELTLLAIAVAIAVAALSAVGLFAERMRGALSLEARQLLGADLLISADREPPAELDARARAAGLAVTRTAVFPSMVGAGDALRLGSVKAVGEGYPLRGDVTLGAPRPGPAGRIPSPGAVWLDEALMNALGARPGDTVTLGDARLRVEAVITLEPDRGANFVNFAPRALLRLDELAATGLVQPTSRVTWRVLVAGEPAAVERFRDDLELQRGQRLETLDSGRPELRATLDRAERFLALVALLTALLAAVAIGLAARRYAQRHTDGIAVMKALGATQRELVVATLLELGLLGLASGAIGVAAGWAAQAVLVAIAAPLIGIALPAPSWVPAVQALAAGLVLLAGAAVVPLRALAGVPPLRVLRGELPAPAASVWQAGAATLAAFALLVAWSVRDLRLAAIGLGGFVLGAGAFAAAAAAAVRASGWARGAVGLAGGDRAVLRVALASWGRRRGASIAQTAALSVALMALVLLTVTRDDLLASWRRASPADAPDRFLINIQPDQRDAVAAMLRAAGIAAPDLYPMVRGRLVAIDDRPIAADELGERARRMVDREMNLSYAAHAPAHNVIVAGRDVASGAAEVTVEQGLADLLGVAPGARLTFDVAGEPLKLSVAGVRKLAWDSMRVNFFVIGTPEALADRPQSWITAFRVPAGAPGLPDDLVRRFPNLTVFDTGNLLRQVQAILDRVAAAVEFLFIFTLAAGLLVLAAALAGSRDERLHEAALLRALGASRRQLARAQGFELALGGAAAGLLASLGALALAWVLARAVFDFPFAPRWWTVPATALCGAAAALAVGWAGLRGVLAVPPLQALRR